MRERRCASQIEVGVGDEATLRVEGRERRCASQIEVEVGDERGCAARTQVASWTRQNFKGMLKKKHQSPGVAAKPRPLPRGEAAT